MFFRLTISYKNELPLYSYQLCRWLLDSSDTSRVVVLEIEQSFDVESGYDFVNVYDGSKS